MEENTRNESWEAYYKKMNPDARGKLLAELSAAEDGPETELRKKLYVCRYQKKRGRTADRGLYACFLLMDLCRNRFGGAAEAKRKGREALDMLCVGELWEAGDAAREILYQEFRNIFRCYLETTKDSGYGKKLLGLMQSTPEEKEQRAMEDLYDMSRGAARVLRPLGDPFLSEQMQLICRAADDAFASLGDGAAERYEEFRKKK